MAQSRLQYGTMSSEKTTFPSQYVSFSSDTNVHLTDQLNYAHAAAPNVKLYINDYNIESVNNKSMALLDIAKNLLGQGAPLHGIGFESHFIGGQTPDDIAESMKMFTDIGLDVAITELDVRVPVNNQGITNSTWLGIQSVLFGWRWDIWLIRQGD